MRSNKLKLWHKLKSHPHDPQIRAKYRACVFKWKEYCLSQEMQTEERLIESNNIGAFFRHVNKRITHRSSVSVIITDSGDVLSDDKDKANAFNKYYASVGVADNNILPHITRVSEPNVVLDCIDINETDILFAISKLKNNLACGPDKLPPIFFRQVKHSLAVPLSMVFTQLLSVAAVPDEWKSAIVIPVFKKGVPSSVSNYRPIS